MSRMNMWFVLVFVVFVRVQAHYDSHHDAHRDNTFLAMAHSYARTKGQDSCWVCGLLPTSSNTYPYVSVPFTLADYATAYDDTQSPFYEENVTFYTRPVPSGPPDQVKLSYVPKGVICWENNGTGVFLGRSTCNYSLSVSKPWESMQWHGRFVVISMFELMPDLGIVDKAAPNGTMYVCGKHAYSYLPAGWSGSCYTAYVVPAMRMGNFKHREKRDLFLNKETVATPTQRFFVSLVPTYGITVALDKIRQMAFALDKIANDTAGALTLINQELHSVRQMTLQNRIALDIILADKGGTCAVLKQECCTYVPDESVNVTAYVQDIYDQVAHLKESQKWNWELWLGSWAGELLPQIIQIVAPFITLILGVCLLFKGVTCLVSRIVTPARVAQITATFSTTENLFFY